MIEGLGFITPIQFMTPIQGIGSVNNSTNDINKTTDTKENTFASIFANAYNDVKTTNANLEQQQYLLATGQIDDAHTVPIAAAQAQLSADLLVQLRNKAVEAYNEMMRISV